MLIHSHTIHTINVYRAGERAHAAREREGEREPERDIRERECVWGVGGGGGEGGRYLSFHSAQCFVTSSTLSLLKQTNKQRNK